jgi:hypothetical protein
MSFAGERFDGLALARMGEGAGQPVDQAPEQAERRLVEWVRFVEQGFDRLADGADRGGQSGFIGACLREIAEQAEDGDKAVVAARLGQDRFTCQAAGKVVKNAENFSRESHIWVRIKRQTNDRQLGEEI